MNEWATECYRSWLFIPFSKWERCPDACKVKIKIGIIKFVSEPKKVVAQSELSLFTNNVFLL